MSSISALDRPIALAELTDAAALDEVIKSYSAFHGVTMALVDITGKTLAQAGEMTDLCGAVRDRPAGLARCTGKLREVADLRPMLDAPPARCDCFTGLRYQVEPLSHDGTLLGTLILGPYLPDTRPPALTGIVQAILGADGLDGGEAALAHLRPMSDAVARRTLEHVARIIDVLVHSAYARQLTAQLHETTLAETFDELADKNRRLAAAVERMQEVDRLKSNFLATVSHELRTPLTSVIGYSEMLLEGLAGALNQEQHEYVQIIMEKGDQLLQLITGILDVTRMEGGALHVAHEPVDLVDVISNALASMAPLARRKRLELRNLAPPDAPRVQGDRDKLRQVLLNLIGNAIKFTAEGGRVEVHVEVGALAREGDLLDGPLVPHEADAARLGVRMRVADNGIGIAPEKQARIFEPFFQVDSSSTREYGGTGLGLTLVKSYIEAHGGHVWVDSDLGQGSAFTVTLPAIDEEVVAFVRARSAAARPGDVSEPSAAGNDPAGP